VPWVDLHPKTRVSVALYAPTAELIELSRADDAYYKVLAGLWEAGEGFLVIEQDIEVHAEVVPYLEACGERWCVYPYPGPAGAYGDPLTYYSLGCTKFSAELLAEAPSLMADLESHDWRRLDALMLPLLREAAGQPHWHSPPVNHHHVRPWVLQRRCDCGEILP
jgi:hypothetical protein